MQNFSKLVSPTLTLPKNFLILLPLSRENISSFLSPILGLYSIKPKDFLERFIEQFNLLTQNRYRGDFSDFLFEETSCLSLTTNITVPIKIAIINFEKFEYNLSILQPSLSTLRQFSTLNLTSSSDLFDVSIKQKFIPH
jgi:hypothetical protein